MTSPQEYVYVSASQIQRFKLNTGDILSGKVRPPKEDEKYNAMLFFENVNGIATADILKEEERKMQNHNAKDMRRYEVSHVGILDKVFDGFGFLRKENYLPGEDDIYVSPHQIKRYFTFATRRRNYGQDTHPQRKRTFRCFAVCRPCKRQTRSRNANRPVFERLIPVFPNEKLVLETSKDVLSHALWIFVLSAKDSAV